MGTTVRGKVQIKESKAATIFGEKATRAGEPFDSFW